MGAGLIITNREIHMLRKLSCLSIIVTSLSISSLNPISPTQAKVASLATALFAGGLSTYVDSKANIDQRSKIIGAAAVAGVIGVLTYYLTSRCTPANRYERAVHDIALVAGDELFSKEFGSYKELKNYLQLRFSVDWYLVAGKKRLSKLFKRLSSARTLIQHVTMEASSPAPLLEMCKKADEQIESLLKKYEYLLSLVESDSEEYHEQRRHYDAHLERYDALEDETGNDMRYWDRFTLEKQCYKEQIAALRLALKYKA